MNKKEMLVKELNATKNGGRGLKLLNRSGKFVWPLALVLCWLPVFLVADLTISQQFLLFMATLIPISFLAGKLVSVIDTRIIIKQLSRWQ